MKREKKYLRWFKEEYHGLYRKYMDSFGGDLHKMVIQRMIVETALQLKKDHLQYLLEKEDINILNGWKTAVFELAGRPFPQALELLLQSGGNPNAVVNGTLSPLMHAAMNNHLQNVKLLIQYGANPDYRDDGGDTALSLAESNGNTEVADYLKSLSGN